VEKKKGVKVEEKVDESYSETGSEISDPSAIDQASISDGSETPSSSQEGKGPSKAEKEPPAKVTKKVSKNEKGIFSKKESKRESIKEDKEHRNSFKKNASTEKVLTTSITASTTTQDSEPNQDRQLAKSKRKSNDNSGHKRCQIL